MPERLLDVLHQFTQTILNPYDVTDVLDQLIEHSMHVLEADGAGIMLADQRGDLGFAAASGDRVTHLELVQEKSESGVCYHAFTINEVVVASSLEDLERWPDYVARAREVGFESAIGIPLNACGQTMGVLNVYRETAGPWTDDDIEAGEILGSMAAGYILNSTQLRAKHELAEQLQGALDSRAVIEQAKGILMAAEGVNAESAFKALRTASMESNRKLREVAQELVDRNDAS
jgi:signal transduction protein with GAF and PtsI domain